MRSQPLSTSSAIASQSLTYAESWTGPLGQASAATGVTISALSAFARSMNAPIGVAVPE